MSTTDNIEVVSNYKTAPSTVSKESITSGYSI